MEVELRQGEEYRMEVAEDKTVRVMVLAGIGEVNGQELLVEKWYVFSGIKTSIFTFTGLKMKVDGTTELAYVAHSSMFPEAFSHFKALGPNPTVLVLGNGRSTLTATLCNFYIRLHKKVIFTELDPSSSNIFPGSLSSLLNENLIEYNNHFMLNNPICLFYGSTDISNVELYELQVKRLRELVSERYLKEREHPQIILAPNFYNVSEQTANQYLSSICKEFGVTDVFVIGNERLLHKINLFSKKYFIENTGYINENKIQKCINRYFNGAGGEYATSTVSLKGGWEVVRVGEEFVAPESALPLGATRRVEQIGVSRVELADCAVLGISEAESEEQVPVSPVMGFVVCAEAGKLKVLCTQPKLSKKKYLIQGSLKYLEY